MPPKKISKSESSEGSLYIPNKKSKKKYIAELKPVDKSSSPGPYYFMHIGEERKPNSITSFYGGDVIPAPKSVTIPKTTSIVSLSSNSSSTEKPKKPKSIPKTRSITSLSSGSTSSSKQKEFKFSSTDPEAIALEKRFQNFQKRYEHFLSEDYFLAEKGMTRRQYQQKLHQEALEEEAQMIREGRRKLLPHEIPPVYMSKEYRDQLNRRYTLQEGSEASSISLPSKISLPPFQPILPSYDSDDSTKSTATQQSSKSKVNKTTSNPKMPKRISSGMVPDEYFDHNKKAIHSVPYGLLDYVQKHRYLGPKLRSANKNIGRSVGVASGQYDKIQHNAGRCKKGQSKVRQFKVITKDVNLHGHTYKVPTALVSVNKSSCYAKSRAKMLKASEKDEREIRKDDLIANYRKGVGKQRYQKLVAKRNPGILGGFM